MFHAARNEISSNSWKLSVISDAGISACVIGQPLAQIQVRRTTRQEQQLDPQLPGQRHYDCVSLIPGVVQHQSDRLDQPPSRHRPRVAGTSCPFSADVAVRVAIPFCVHDLLLVLGQRDPEDGPVLALGGPHPRLTSSPVRQASSLGDTSPARPAISSPAPACSWRWTARSGGREPRGYGGCPAAGPSSRAASSPRSP